MNKVHIFIFMNELLSVVEFVFQRISHRLQKLQKFNPMKVTESTVFETILPPYLNHLGDSLRFKGIFADDIMFGKVFALEFWSNF